MTDPQPSPHRAQEHICGDPAAACDLECAARAAPLDDDWKIPFRRMMQIECMCGDVFDNIEAFIEHGRMAHDICECPEERLSQATVYGLSEASENTCARCGLSFAPAPPEPHREQE